MFLIGRLKVAKTLRLPYIRNTFRTDSGLENRNDIKMKLRYSKVGVKFS